MNQLVGPTGRDRGFCESGGGGCGVVPFELDTNQRQQSDESNNTALPSPGRFTKTQQVPTGSTGSTGVLQDPVTRDPVPQKQGDDRVHHRAALENVRPTATPQAPATGSAASPCSPTTSPRSSKLPSHSTSTRLATSCSAWSSMCPRATDEGVGF